MIFCPVSAGTTNNKPQNKHETMASSPYHLTSNGPRVNNTLVIDLANLPAKKINMEMIAKFIHDKLRIQFSSIQSLQHNTGKSLVFIECQTEELAIAVTERNDGNYEISVDNVKYKVNVFMEDGATTVRVHDISPQTENSSIEKELERYGDIVWLKEEMWTEPAVLKGIPNGVRSVRIRLHTAIPSYININGEVTLVTYKHQQQTCRHCGKPVHWGRKCIEAGYMEMQLNGGNISDRLRASGVDYAGVLKTSNQTGTSQEIRNSVSSEAEKNRVDPNYTNLTQLFNKSSSQGQDRKKITTNTVESNEKLAIKSTNTNTNSKFQSPSENTESSAAKTATSKLARGSMAVNPIASGIEVSNNFDGLDISDDDMDGTHASGCKSPSRKKIGLSVDSSE